MSGPYPVPTQLKILNGNPGKRPLNHDEPQPDPAIPPRPEWLDAAARAKWDEMVPLLHKVGLLTNIDGDSLAAYCVAWSELQAASVILAKEGRIIRTLTGRTVAHPAVNLQRTALKALQNFSSLFGMNPSTRSRVKVEKREEEDPLDKLLGGTGT